MSPERIKSLLLSIVGLGLVVRLAHFWAISNTAFPEITFRFTESDLFAFWQWAQEIRGGDWLGRDTYHPYFEWMRALAPLETWYEWWGGKEIFHQAPLYPYLIALVSALVAGERGIEIESVLLVQLLLGSLQPLILFGIGRRLFDVRTGLVAAAMAACYGPFIFHEGALIRDWLPPLLEPLSLLVLLKARETGLPFYWSLGGAVLGLAILAKPTILLFLPLVVIWILWEQRGGWKAPACNLLLVSLGLIVTLFPLFARNASVDAPLFAISNRAAEGLIEGNAADGWPIGLYHPPSLPRILEQSNGSVPAVIRLILETYQGDWLGFLGHQLVKLRALGDPFEIPNNVYFGYGLEISPVLSWMLRYDCVLPLGILGFAFTLRSWRDQKLLLLYTFAALVGVLATIILARYRLVLVPIFILYGSAAIVGFIDYLRTRTLKPVLGMVVGMIGLSVLQQEVIPLKEMYKDRVHSSDYRLSAQIYSDRKQFGRAAMEMGRLIDKARESQLHQLEVPQFELEYRIYRARNFIRQEDRNAAQDELQMAASALEIVKNLPGTPHGNMLMYYYNLGILHLKLADESQARSYLQRFVSLAPPSPVKTRIQSLLLELR